MKRNRPRAATVGLAIAWLIGTQFTVPASAQYQLYNEEHNGLPEPRTGRSPQQHAQIISIRQIGGSSKSGIGASVEISLSSDAPFDAPSGEQLKLMIGAVHFHNYRYDHGNRKVVIFTMDKSSFDALPNGSMVKVGFGLQRGMRWDADALQKSMLLRY